MDFKWPTRFTRVKSQTETTKMIGELFTSPHSTQSSETEMVFKWPHRNRPTLKTASEDETKSSWSDSGPQYKSETVKPMASEELSLQTTDAQLMEFKWPHRNRPTLKTASNDETKSSWSDSEPQYKSETVKPMASEELSLQTTDAQLMEFKWPQRNRPTLKTASEDETKSSWSDSEPQHQSETVKPMASEELSLQTTDAQLMEFKWPHRNRPTLKTASKDETKSSWSDSGPQYKSETVKPMASEESSLQTTDAQLMEFKWPQRNRPTLKTASEDETKSSWSDSGPQHQSETVKPMASEELSLQTTDAQLMEFKWPQRNRPTLKTASKDETKSSWSDSGPQYKSETVEPMASEELSLQTTDAQLMEFKWPQRNRPTLKTASEYETKSSWSDSGPQYKSETVKPMASEELSLQTTDTQLMEFKWPQRNRPTLKTASEDETKSSWSDSGPQHQSETVKPMASEELSLETTDAQLMEFKWPHRNRSTSKYQIEFSSSDSKSESNPETDKPVQKTTHAQQMKFKWPNRMRPSIETTSVPNFFTTQGNSENGNVLITKEAFASSNPQERTVTNKESVLGITSSNDLIPSNLHKSTSTKPMIEGNQMKFKWPSRKAQSSTSYSNSATENAVTAQGTKSTGTEEQEMLFKWPHRNRPTLKATSEQNVESMWPGSTPNFPKTEENLKSESSLASYGPEDKKSTNPESTNSEEQMQFKWTSSVPNLNSQFETITNSDLNLALQQKTKSGLSGPVSEQSQPGAKSHVAVITQSQEENKIEIETSATSPKAINVKTTAVKSITGSTSISTKTESDTTKSKTTIAEGVTRESIIYTESKSSKFEEKEILNSKKTTEEIQISPISETEPTTVCHSCNDATKHGTLEEELDKESILGKQKEDQNVSSSTYKETSASSPVDEDQWEHFSDFHSKHTTKIFGVTKENGAETEVFFSNVPSVEVSTVLTPAEEGEFERRKSSTKEYSGPTEEGAVEHSTRGESVEYSPEKISSTVTRILEQNEQSVVTLIPTNREEQYVSKAHTATVDIEKELDNLKQQLQSLATASNEQPQEPEDSNENKLNSVLENIGEDLQSIKMLVTTSSEMQTISEIENFDFTTERQFFTGSSEEEIEINKPTPAESEIAEKDKSESANENDNTKFYKTETTNEKAKLEKAEEDTSLVYAGTEMITGPTQEWMYKGISSSTVENGAKGASEAADNGSEEENHVTDSKEIPHQFTEEESSSSQTEKLSKNKEISLEGTMPLLSENVTPRPGQEEIGFSLPTFVVEENTFSAETESNEETLFSGFKTIGNIPDQLLLTEKPFSPQTAGTNIESQEEQFLQTEETSSKFWLQKNKQFETESSYSILQQKESSFYNAERENLTPEEVATTNKESEEGGQISSIIVNEIGYSAETSQKEERLSQSADVENVITTSEQAGLTSSTTLENRFSESVDNWLESSLVTFEAEAKTENEGYASTYPNILKESQSMEVIQKEETSETTGNSKTEEHFQVSENEKEESSTVAFEAQAKTENEGYASTYPNLLKEGQSMEVTQKEETSETTGNSKTEEHFQMSANEKEESSIVTFEAQAKTENEGYASTYPDLLKESQPMEVTEEEQTSEITGNSKTEENFQVSANEKEESSIVTFEAQAKTENEVYASIYPNLLKESQSVEVTQKEETSETTGNSKTEENFQMSANEKEESSTATFEAQAKTESEGYASTYPNLLKESQSMEVTQKEETSETTGNSKTEEHFQMSANEKEESSTVTFEAQAKTENEGYASTYPDLLKESQPMEVTQKEETSETTGNSNTEEHFQVSANEKEESSIVTFEAQAKTENEGYASTYPNLLKESQPMEVTEKEQTSETTGNSKIEENFQVSANEKEESSIVTFEAQAKTENEGYASTYPNVLKESQPMEVTEKEQTSETTENSKIEENFQVSANEKEESSIVTFEAQAKTENEGYASTYPNLLKESQSMEVTEKEQTSETIGNLKTEEIFQVSANEKEEGLKPIVISNESQTSNIIEGNLETTYSKQLFPISENADKGQEGMETFLKSDETGEFSTTSKYLDLSGNTETQSVLTEETEKGVGSSTEQYSTSQPAGVSEENVSEHPSSFRTYLFEETKQHFTSETSPLLIETESELEMNHSTENQATVSSFASEAKELESTLFAHSEEVSNGGYSLSTELGQGLVSFASSEIEEVGTAINVASQKSESESAGFGGLEEGFTTEKGFSSTQLQNEATTESEKKYSLYFSGIDSSTEKSEKGYSLGKEGYSQYVSEFQLPSSHSEELPAASVESSAKELSSENMSEGLESTTVNQLGSILEEETISQTTETSSGAFQGSDVQSLSEAEESQIATGYLEHKKDTTKFLKGQEDNLPSTSIIENDNLSSRPEPQEIEGEAISKNEESTERKEAVVEGEGVRMSSVENITPSTSAEEIELSSPSSPVEKERIHVGFNGETSTKEEEQKTESYELLSSQISSAIEYPSESYKETSTERRDSIVEGEGSRMSSVENITPVTSSEEIKLSSPSSPVEKERIYGEKSTKEEEQQTESYELSSAQTPSATEYPFESEGTRMSSVENITPVISTEEIKLSSPFSPVEKERISGEKSTKEEQQTESYELSSPQMPSATEYSSESYKETSTERRESIDEGEDSRMSSVENITPVISSEEIKLSSPSSPVEKERIYGEKSTKEGQKTESYELSSSQIPSAIEYSSESYKETSTEGEGSRMSSVENITPVISTEEIKVSSPSSPVEKERIYGEKSTKEGQKTESYELSSPQISSAIEYHSESYKETSTERRYTIVEGESSRMSSVENVTPVIGTEEIKLLSPSSPVEKEKIYGEKSTKEEEQQTESFELSSPQRPSVKEYPSESYEETSTEGRYSIVEGEGSRMSSVENITPVIGTEEIKLSSSSSVEEERMSVSFNGQRSTEEEQLTEFNELSSPQIPSTIEYLPESFEGTHVEITQESHTHYPVQNTVEFGSSSSVKLEIYDQTESIPSNSESEEMQHSITSERYKELHDHLGKSENEENVSGSSSTEQGIPSTLSNLEEVEKSEKKENISFSDTEEEERQNLEGASSKSESDEESQGGRSTKSSSEGGLQSQWNFPSTKESIIFEETEESKQPLSFGNEISEDFTNNQLPSELKQEVQSSMLTTNAEGVTKYFEVGGVSLPTEGEGNVSENWEDIETESSIMNQHEGSQLPHEIESEEIATKMENEITFSTPANEEASAIVETSVIGSSSSRYNDNLLHGSKPEESMPTLAPEENEIGVSAEEEKFIGLHNKKTTGNGATINLVKDLDELKEQLEILATVASRGTKSDGLLEDGVIENIKHELEGIQKLLTTSEDIKTMSFEKELQATEPIEEEGTEKAFSPLSAIKDTEEEETRGGFFGRSSTIGGKIESTFNLFEQTEEVSTIKHSFPARIVGEETSLSREPEATERFYLISTANGKLTSEIRDHKISVASTNEEKEESGNSVAFEKVTHAKFPPPSFKETNPTKHGNIVQTEIATTSSDKFESTKKHPTEGYKKQSFTIGNVEEEDNDHLMLELSPKQEKKSTLCELCTDEEEVEDRKSSSDRSGSTAGKNIEIVSATKFRGYPKVATTKTFVKTLRCSKETAEESRLASSSLTKPTEERVRIMTSTVSHGMESEKNIEEELATTKRKEYVETVRTEMQDEEKQQGTDNLPTVEPKMTGYEISKPGEENQNYIHTTTSEVSEKQLETTSEGGIEDLFENTETSSIGITSMTTEEFVTASKSMEEQLKGSGVSNTQEQLTTEEIHTAVTMRHEEHIANNLSTEEIEDLSSENGLSNTEIETTNIDRKLQSTSTLEAFASTKASSNGVNKDEEGAEYTTLINGNSEEEDEVYSKLGNSASTLLTNEETQYTQRESTTLEYSGTTTENIISTVENELTSTESPLATEVASLSDDNIYSVMTLESAGKSTIMVSEIPEEKETMRSDNKELSGNVHTESAVADTESEETISYSGTAREEYELTSGETSKLTKESYLINQGEEPVSEMVENINVGENEEQNPEALYFAHSEEDAYSKFTLQVHANFTSIETEEEPKVATSSTEKESTESNEGSAATKAFKLQGSTEEGTEEQLEEGFGQNVSTENVETVSELSNAAVSTFKGTNEKTEESEEEQLYESIVGANISSTPSPSATEPSGTEEYFPLSTLTIAENNVSEETSEEIAGTYREDKGQTVSISEETSEEIGGTYSEDKGQAEEPMLTKETGEQIEEVSTATIGQESQNTEIVKLSELEETTKANEELGHTQQSVETLSEENEKITSSTKNHGGEKLDTSNYGSDLNVLRTVTEFKQSENEIKVVHTTKWRAGERQFSTAQEFRGTSEPFPSQNEVEEENNQQLLPQFSNKHESSTLCETCEEDQEEISERIATKENLKAKETTPLPNGFEASKSVTESTTFSDRGIKIGSTEPEEGETAFFSEFLLTSGPENNENLLLTGETSIATEEELSSIASTNFNILTDLTESETSASETPAAEMESKENETITEAPPRKTDNLTLSEEEEQELEIPERSSTVTEGVSLSSLEDKTIFTQNNFGILKTITEPVGGAEDNEVSSEEKFGLKPGSVKIYSEPQNGEEEMRKSVTKSVGTTVTESELTSIQKEERTESEIIAFHPHSTISEESHTSTSELSLTESIPAEENNEELLHKFSNKAGEPTLCEGCEEQQQISEQGSTIVKVTSMKTVEYETTLTQDNFNGLQSITEFPEPVSPEGWSKSSVYSEEEFGLETISSSESISATINEPTSVQKNVISNEGEEEKTTLGPSINEGEENPTLTSALPESIPAEENNSEEVVEYSSTESLGLENNLDVLRNLTESTSNGQLGSLTEPLEENENNGLTTEASTHMNTGTKSTTEEFDFHTKVSTKYPKFSSTTSEEEEQKLEIPERSSTVTEGVSLSSSEDKTIFVQNNFGILKTITEPVEGAEENEASSEEEFGLKPGSVKIYSEPQNGEEEMRKSGTESVSTAVTESEFTSVQKEEITESEIISFHSHSTISESISATINEPTSVQKNFISNEGKEEKTTLRPSINEGEENPTLTSALPESIPAEENNEELLHKFSNKPEEPTLCEGCEEQQQISEQGSTIVKVASMKIVEYETTLIQNNFNELQSITEFPETVSPEGWSKSSVYSEEEFGLETISSSESIKNVVSTEGEEEKTTLGPSINEGEENLTLTSALPESIPAEENNSEEVVENLSTESLGLQNNLDVLRNLTESTSNGQLGSPKEQLEENENNVLPTEALDTGTKRTTEEFDFHSKASTKYPKFSSTTTLNITTLMLLLTSIYGANASNGETTTTHPKIYVDLPIFPNNMSGVHPNENVFNTEKNTESLILFLNGRSHLLKYLNGSKWYRRLKFPAVEVEAEGELENGEFTIPLHSSPRNKPTTEFENAENEVGFSENNVAGEEENELGDETEISRSEPSAKLSNPETSTSRRSPETISTGKSEGISKATTLFTTASPSHVTCQKNDFDEGKNCLCAIDGLISGLNEKNLDERTVANISCRQFLSVESGIIIGNNSEAEVRKKRSYWFMKNEMLMKMKRETLHYTDEFFDEKVVLENTVDQIYALPETRVTIPCFAKSGVEEFTRYMEFSWTIDGERTIPDNQVGDKDGHLTIPQALPKDGGNYSCLVKSRLNDNENSVQTYTHKLIIISTPIYKLKNSVIYTMSKSCTLKDCDLIASYLPKITNNMFCGHNKSLCHVMIQRPVCIRNQDNLINVTFTITMLELRQIFPKLNNNHCGINCQIQLYSKISSIVMKNVKIFGKQPIISTVHQSAITFNPDKSIDVQPQMKSLLIITCPPGYGIDKNQPKFCVECPKNTFNDGKESYCKMCPAGQYQLVPGSRYCKTCSSILENSACLRQMYTNTEYFKVYVAVATSSVVALVLAIYFCTSRPNRDLAISYSRDLEAGVKQPLLAWNEGLPPRLPPLDF